MTWVTVPDLGKGLNLDATPEELELGVSTSAQNMRFRNGYVERFRGIETVYTTPPVTPYHICHFMYGTTRYVVYAGTQRTFADDGTTQTEITNANNTGTLDDRWSGIVFNGIYIQNNGVDVPQYWNGNTATNLADLTAWPAGHKAGFIRPFGNFLVAGDITRSGTREPDTLLWSHSADPNAIPTSWDIADATKDAGDVSLSETNGSLIDALPMGAMNILYKDDSIFYQQQVQNAAIFRFGRLPGDTGLLARGCVVDTPIGHVLLTPGLDVVVHNGQGLQSIITGIARNWLSDNINQSNAIRSFLAVSPGTSEVLVCIPTGSSATCDKALVFNWRDKTWYTRDLSNVTYGSTGQVVLASTSTWSGSTTTWTTESGTWSEFADISGISRLIFTRSTPTLAMFDSTELDHGSSFNASFERTGLHFDAPERMKLCRGVRPKIDSSAGAVIKIQVGTQMVPDGTVTWASAQDYTVGTSIETHSIVTGRFLAVKLYTTGNTWWRLRSLQMDIQPMGMY